MNKIYLGICGLIIGLSSPLKGQTKHHITENNVSYKIVEGIRFELKNEFHTDQLNQLQTGVYYTPQAYPKPLSNSKKHKPLVNALRDSEGIKYSKDRNVSRRSASEPTVLAGFSGALGAGIPNDNNVAVSNSGWVVSVLNTHIRIYDKDGKWYRNWGLEFFPNSQEQTAPDGVGLLDRSYDPKIVFDPEANRFILVYLEGSESSDTRIITAFSKSDNPLDGWFVYQIDGNPFVGKTWSDYPIIGISKEDLYITVNILKDSTDWRDGFTQSVIWQVPKQLGYLGQSLKTNLISDIRYNNKSIWSICAIPAGFNLFENGMFFLSVRPGDMENDTLFLHRIHTNFSQGTPQYSLQVLKTNKKYGLPPDAYQPSEGFRLQSNDTRVLSGFVHAGKIQYVQTTRNFESNRSAIFHATIHDVFETPFIEAQIVGSDSLDLAYPSIVYAGDGGWNHNAMLTFSHSSENHFPGTSAIYRDNSFNYSPIVTLKKGIGLINTFLPDSFERWGDYTGIQRDYSEPGAFWTSGSFGNEFNRNGTWINKIKVNDVNVGVSKQQPTTHKSIAYPNPAKDQLHVSFHIEQPESFTIYIYDMTGKIVYTTQKETSFAGRHLFVMQLNDLVPGIYTYQISAFSQAVIEQGKFIIQK